MKRILVVLASLTLGLNARAVELGDAEMVTIFGATHEVSDRVSVFGMTADFWTPRPNAHKVLIYSGAMIKLSENWTSVPCGGAILNWVEDGDAFMLSHWLMGKVGAFEVYQEVVFAHTKAEGLDFVGIYSIDYINWAIEPGLYVEQYDLGPVLFGPRGSIRAGPVTFRFLFYGGKMKPVVDGEVDEDAEGVWTFAPRFYAQVLY